MRNDEAHAYPLLNSFSVSLWYLEIYVTYFPDVPFMNMGRVGQSV